MSSPGVSDTEDSQPLPFVFEIAWEVANKVGGIYTVIRSKAPVTAKALGDRYCLIGPYNANHAATEVETMEPSSQTMADCLNAMRQNGVNVVFGRWLIDGHPKVILFDVGSCWDRLHRWKKDLYDQAYIGTPEHDDETNNSVVFGFLVCWFLGEFYHRSSGVYMVAHFHEWLSAVGLILVRTRRLNIATVFTTHATLLGRYLCAGNVDFYNNLPHFDCDKEAGDRGIYHRYTLERAAAHSAHVFTTVSQITADESQYLLGRRPGRNLTHRFLHADLILPNGLNVVQFSALHEFQNLHAQHKEKIHNFVRGHFYGHLDFDLDKTLYFFIAGRYEYSNKGADLFIESLARLNARLKAAGSDTTVVAFLIMPAPTNNFNVDALKGQAVTKQLRDTVNDIQQHIAARMFEAAARGNLPDTRSILSDDEIVRLKRCIRGMQRQTLPPIVTHNMVDDARDPILNHLRRVHLFNNTHDRVKVIFHPEFLSSTNPLFPIDYDDFVRGCHLGVFPSYYEPWGYTPAECTVMGVPSVTSNLAGFGGFIHEHIDDPASYGLYVIDRRFKSVEESIQQLAQYMHDFCSLTRRQRINLRNRTERCSELLDWKRLILYYTRARELALARQYPHMYSVESERSSRPLFTMPRAGSAPSSPKPVATPLDDETEEALESIHL